jgi:hypothetical protein
MARPEYTSNHERAARVAECIDYQADLLDNPNLTPHRRERIELKLERLRDELHMLEHPAETAEKRAARYAEHPDQQAAPTPRDRQLANLGADKPAMPAPPAFERAAKPEPPNLAEAQQAAANALQRPPEP